jgi:hypothetical protein
VDGVYLGPLDLDDVPTLVDDLRAGRAPLDEKRLSRRPVADPRARTATPGPPLAAGPPMPPQESRLDQPAPVEEDPDA